MPLNSVSAAPPVAPTKEEAPRQLRQLAGIVYGHGRCRTAVFEPGGEDPWFPVESDEAKLDAAAVSACAGCPVIAECLEMTLQLEASLPRPSIVGIFGATPGYRRLQMIGARRGGERR